MQIIKEIKKRRQITLPKKLAVQQGISFEEDFLFLDAHNDTIILKKLRNRGELVGDDVFYVYDLPQSS